MLVGPLALMCRTVQPFKLQYSLTDLPILVRMTYAQYKINRSLHSGVYDPLSRYRIDHAKEWVMRLYNPRVCG